MAVGYGRFLDAFAPLADAPIPPAEALLLRLLLVHEWHRLVLRDPLLPAALLPEAWPDAEGPHEGGALPPAPRAPRLALC